MGAGTPARSPQNYCPDPVTGNVTTATFLGLATATPDARAPTALGLKATVNVHDACVTIEPEQGLVPLGVTMNSPLLVIAGTSDVEKLFVSVTVWGALAVPTACGPNVSAVGERVKGCRPVPFKSNTCWPTEALSVNTIAPVADPVAPNAGEKTTVKEQRPPAGRLKAARHVALVPFTTKPGVTATELRVTALALTFLTLRVLMTLIVPGTVLKLMFDGENASGDALPPEPVPESPTTCGPYQLSLMARAPKMDAVDVGVNVRATLHLAPAAREEPQVVPDELMAKLPLAVNDKGKVLVVLLVRLTTLAGDVVPTACVPKATVAGLSESGVTPVPVSEIICGESGASSLMVIEPGTDPISVGLNPTVKEQVPLWGIW